MDIHELIKKNKKYPTPESLREMNKKIPGSVYELKMKKGEAFSINQEIINTWLNKNKKTTLLTK